MYFSRLGFSLGCLPPSSPYAGSAAGDCTFQRLKNEQGGQIPEQDEAAQSAAEFGVAHLRKRLPIAVRGMREIMKKSFLVSGALTAAFVPVPFASSVRAFPQATSTTQIEVVESNRKSGTCP